MTALPRNIAAQAQPLAAVAAAAVLRKLVQDVERILRTARLPVNTEAELQEEVAKLFDRHRIIYGREVKIAGGRIDFLVGYAGRFDGAPSAAHCGDRAADRGDGRPGICGGLGR